MRKNKILGNIRIESDLYNQLLKALSEINSNNLIELSLQDVRRLAYKLFCKRILVEKDLNFQIGVR